MRGLLSIARVVLNVFSSARFKVAGDSMLPALADAQSVLAVRPRFSWNRLRRGDVVVLRHPVWNDRTYIKRIVGLPNEEIRVEDGLVYLGGVLLEEAYVEGPVTEPERKFREWWTGEGEYFVLGDDRRDSQDSRAFGPVDRGLILGRVVGSALR